MSLGFVDGELACTDECVLETGGCQSCGNGLIDEGEACDGENFGGLDCLSLGLGEGALVCNSDCTRDDSACADPAFDGENNGLEDPPDAVEPGQGAAAQQGCSAAPGRAGPAAVVAWGLVFLVAFRRRRRSAPPA